MKKIITISRTFGSGGHDVGALVAKKLGIDLYDKEILTMAAEESGINIEHFEAADEKPTNSFLYSIAMSGQIYSTPNDFLTNDRLFAYQSNTILKAAKEKPGVFVGRCADYVLKDIPNALHIFIHADLECRVKRIIEINGISEAEAKSRIKKADKRRASYHNFYAEGKWGDAVNYDLCINSSVLGVEGTADYICEFVNRTK